MSWFSWFPDHSLPDRLRRLAGPADFRDDHRPEPVQRMAQCMREAATRIEQLEALTSGLRMACEQAQLELDAAGMSSEANRLAAYLNQAIRDAK